MMSPDKWENVVQVMLSGEKLKGNFAVSESSV